MKLWSGISLLLLAAIAHAAPSPRAFFRHAYYQHPEQVGEEPSPIAHDVWPTDEYYDEGDGSLSLTGDSYDYIPAVGTVDIDVYNGPDTHSVLKNDTISHTIFKSVERRINEDIRQLQEDLLLFRRLFERQPSGRQPSWVNPWNVVEDTPTIGTQGADHPEDSPHHHHHDYDHSYDHDHDHSYDYDHDHDYFFQHDQFLPDHQGTDDGNFFRGFLPLGGFSGPSFPTFENLPGVGFAEPSDFPDNYDNATHQVHSVNSTQVVVNNTISKESGDDFSSFFHYQVIHLKPEEVFEPVPDNPDQEIPQEHVGEDDEITTTVLPDVDDEVSTGSFYPDSLPEVGAEINSIHFLELDGTRPEKLVSDEEEFGGGAMMIQQPQKKVSARSLHEFNPLVFPADDPNLSTLARPGPKIAAYVSNSLSDEEEEEEEIEWIQQHDDDDDDDEGRRAPDLSSDTRVNRVHVNKQGMTRVDPDAEIFNYGLVMKEAERRDDGEK